MIKFNTAIKSGLLCELSVGRLFWYIFDKKENRFTSKDNVEGNKMKSRATRK